MALIKPFIGFQTAVMASNAFLADVHQIDSSKLISENQTNNQKYKEEKKELLEMKNKKSENEKLDLLLPVQLIIFDKYYTKLSEWQYLDKYTYKDRVLVFNTKEHKGELSSADGFYKDEWLESLEYSKQFEHQTTKIYKYPEKNDENNISWIDGGASGEKLKNLLFLNAPKKIENTFEMHKKIIELDQSFLMSSMLNLYSGYWKKGKMNSENNVIQRVNYGRLKKKYMEAKDIFYDSSSKTMCERFEGKADIDLRNSRQEAEEDGFDAKCDQINLLNFWSFFYNRRTQNIFSSGYAGFKTVKPTNWNTHYYFYFLGNWVLNKPAATQVNDEKEEKNLWYVNFDNVFVPDIKYVTNDFSGSLGKKEDLQMSIYIDYSKITEKNIDSFFQTASSLKYKLKFKTNAADQEVKFTLKDVIESKTFKLSSNHETLNAENQSDLSLSNFEFTVYSDNEQIKLSSKTGVNEFKFEVNLQLIQQQFNVFRKIITNQEVLKTFYFSELKKRQRLDEVFYFAVKKPKESEYMLYKLSDKWMDLLKLEFLGSDLSSAAEIKYYDFLEGKEQKIQSTDLLTLPSLDKKVFSRTEQYSQLNDLIDSQVDQKIGKYFWDNVELKLKSRDLLDGMEEYALKVKTKEAKNEENWDKYFQNTRIKIKNDLTKYIILNSDAYNIEQKVNSNDWTSLFKINTSVNDDLKLNLSDFSFKKVWEDSDFVEIEVEYADVSRLNLVNDVYKDVELKGKSKFKISKKGNYISFRSKEASPIHFFPPQMENFLGL